MLFNHSFVRIFFKDPTIVLSNLLCPYIIVFLSFCILFLLFVNAESSIKISNLELVDKSDNTTVVEDGTFNNLDVLMNVRFEEVNDFIKYKISLHKMVLPKRLYI